MVPPRTFKEGILEYLNNKVSVEDARKCNVFKFSPARQSDIASLKIIAPAALFERIMSAKFWPQGVFMKEFLRRQKIIAQFVKQKTNG